MAGNKRPSFLKRQKEQQRVARAAEKREARRVKKQSKKMFIEGAEDMDITGEPMEVGDGAEQEETETL